MLFAQATIKKHSLWNPISVIKQPRYSSSHKKIPRVLFFLPMTRCCSMRNEKKPRYNNRKNSARSWARWRRKTIEKKQPRYQWRGYPKTGRGKKGINKTNLRLNYFQSNQKTRKKPYLKFIFQKAITPGAPCCFASAFRLTLIRRCCCLREIEGEKKVEINRVNFLLQKQFIRL